MSSNAKAVHSPPSGSLFPASGSMTGCLIHHNFALGRAAEKPGGEHGEEADGNAVILGNVLVHEIEILKIAV